MRIAISGFLSRSFFLLPLLFLLTFSLSVSAQSVVKGKVTDSNSGDPVPFVNITLVGSMTGTTTDFDGNFSLRVPASVDTIVASYIGYKTKKKKLDKGSNVIVNFQLEEEVTTLKEIVVDAGENPAYAILRNVVRNKDKNDKRKLSAYEYDTYTKVEIDVDNMTDKFRKRKIVRKITQVLDSVERIAGEDGKPILPMFISESVSKFYFRDNPRLKYENILKSKINGVGIQDGTLITQFIGTSFQEYNFYQNWLNIVSKDFVSPIADGWRLYYNYDLTDSLYVGDDYCYRLDFYPRSPQDLAFTGTIWVTKKEWALKQVDASVGKTANLNFIEKIRIQQELGPTSAGAWIPVKNRVLVDVSELTNFSAGMLAKFYTSNKNVIVNKPYEPSFYEQEIVMAEDARQYEDETYWDTLRHEPLSETEKNVYRMIDTLQNIPVVKTYTDIIKIAVNGYYNAGKLQLGPYISLAAFNNIEGLRVQGGFKTSYDFSKRWVLGGSVGYGFDDEKVKYSAFVQNILSRQNWTTVSFRVRSDLGRVGIDDEALADNYLFLAAQRFGTFRRGYYFNESRFNFQRQLFKGFQQRFALRYTTFKPVFDFGYYKSPGDESSVSTTFENAEAIIESRWARDELFIINDNERFSLGASKWPEITIRYTHGFKGAFGSDFDYDKLRLMIYKRIRFGPLGTGYANITGEYVFDKLPYPLLSLHLGNQTPIRSWVTYNLMGIGEFISDRFASLQYSHHFEGFLLNRIPLMQKLKWRLVGTTNVIFGGMSQMNRNLIAPIVDEATGLPIMPVGFLSYGRPYIEMGYGVENIFKFVRVDFIHRLSYLEQVPDQRKPRPFGVFVSFQFTL
ncbi:MAG TPA: DUF5686 family protein [Chryseosolibacter sp.]